MITHKNAVKKLGVWLLAGFLLATHLFVRSAHAEEGSSWQEIQSRTGDCKISFPSSPKMMQQALNVSESGHQLVYDVYLAPLNEKSLCLLLVATYPFPLKGGHEIAGLEGLLKGIVGHNLENKLVFAHVVEKRGRPMIDFLVQSPTSFFRGQALMFGNRLYLIAIEGKPGALNEKAFSQFAESFSLVP